MATNRKKEQDGLDLMVAYRQTFSTKAGEKVLEHFKKMYVDRSSFDDQNPHKTSFKEGERNVILTILAMLSIPEQQIIERIENVKKNTNTI